MDADDRRHGVTRGRGDFHAATLVPRHAEQVVDDLETLRTIRIIGAEQIAELAERQARIVAEDQQHAHDIVAFGGNDQFVTHHFR